MLAQALHIFRKDVKALKLEIALSLLLLSLFVLLDTRLNTREGLVMFDRLNSLHAVTAGLTLIGWAALVARVVFLEPLVGMTQFWITRPYRRESLLLAKSMFVLCFINLPFLLSDVANVEIVGPGRMLSPLELLWRQIAVTASLVVVIAPLAAVTQSLTRMVIAILAICTAVVVVMSFVQTNLHSAYYFVGYIEQVAMRVLAIALALCAVCVQYLTRNRKAAFVLIGLAACTQLTPSLLDQSRAIELHGRIVGQDTARGSHPLVFPPEPPALAPSSTTDLRMLDVPMVALNIPLTAANLPPGYVMEPNALTVQVHPVDPSLGTHPTTYAVITSNTAGSVAIQMTRPIFEQLRNEPVRLEISGLYTVLRPSGVVSVPASGRFLSELGRCTVVEYTADPQIRCASLADHLRSVLARESNGTLSFSYRRSMYSPLPHDGLSPIGVMQYRLPRGADRRLEIYRPLGHYQGRLTTPPVRLSDYLQ